MFKFQLNQRKIILNSKQLSDINKGDKGAAINHRSKFEKAHDSIRSLFGLIANANTYKNDIESLFNKQSEEMNDLLSNSTNISEHEKPVVNLLLLRNKSTNVSEFDRHVKAELDDRSNATVSIYVYESDNKKRLGSTFDSNTHLFKQVFIADNRENPHKYSINQHQPIIDRAMWFKIRNVISSNSNKVYFTNQKDEREADLAKLNRFKKDFAVAKYLSSQKPSIKISQEVRNKETTDTSILHEYVNVHPYYSCLLDREIDNDEQEIYNIKGEDAKKIKKEFLTKLNLPDNYNIYQKNHKLHPDVGQAIKNIVEKQVLSSQNTQNMNPVPLQCRYKKSIEKRINLGTDGLRKLLHQKDIGEVLPANYEFSSLKEGEVIVVANANPGLKQNNWEKHSYIAIKGINNTFEKVYELGGQMVLYNSPNIDNLLEEDNPNKIKLEMKTLVKISGVILRKDNNAKDGNKYPLTMSKALVSINSDNQSKLKHLINKGRVFKLKFSPEIIEEAFLKTVQEVKENKQVYLGALYNCNHFTANVIRNAQVLQRSK